MPSEGELRTKTKDENENFHLKKTDRLVCLRHFINSFLFNALTNANFLTPFLQCRSKEDFVRKRRTKTKTKVNVKVIVKVKVKVKVKVIVKVIVKVKVYG